MIRLFAALSIPQEIGAALVPRQAGIDGARWRPLAALHVTLRFYGEVREDVARDLDAELDSLHGSAFEIELAGAGSFGEGPDLHAVWSGVRASRPCATAAAPFFGASAFGFATFLVFTASWISDILLPRLFIG